MQLRSERLLKQLISKCSDTTLKLRIPQLPQLGFSQNYLGTFNTLYFQIEVCYLSIYRFEIYLGTIKHFTTQAQ